MQIVMSDSLAVRNLKKEYMLKRRKILSRLKEFDKFYSGKYSWHFENKKMELRENNNGADRNLFEELCFCILTANTSAEMGMKAIDRISDLLVDGEMEEMRKKLDGVYRFNNIRPAYILHTREFIKKNFKLKDKVEELKNDHDGLRDFFVENVKGFGYKEASHFLRNIGFKGYAILDKHVLNSLIEFNVIDEVKIPLKREAYRKIEMKMKLFSNDIGIPMDEMDLLLWSRRNGKILR